LEVRTFQNVTQVSGKVLLSSIYSKNKEEVFLATGLTPEASRG